MSKPSMLNRLKSTVTRVTPGQIVTYDDASSIKVKPTQFTINQLNSIVSNDRNVVAHLNNGKIHLSVGEKDLIKTNNVNITTHMGDSSIHISAVDRASWNAKETEEGAQQKVNVAFSAAKAHMDNKSLHVSTSERNNWNNKYSREEIDNKFSQLEYNNVWKESVTTFNELFTRYPSPQVGWTATCNDDNITYRYDGRNWIAISANAIPLATIAVDGKMSKQDKAKLDGIEARANRYIHPDNSNVRHVSDKEKDFWNSKAADRVATYEYNGLLSKEDKYKLDSIEEGATNFVMPTEMDPMIIAQDENHRFVTDRERKLWTNKANNNLVTETLDGLMSKYDKIKLNTVQTNANYYVHPEHHSPSIITQDAKNRFVTDDQIALWTNKAAAELATPKNDGLMSKEDKTKLDSVEEGANHYVLPKKLPPSIIEQDANNRFFTDQERELLQLKKDMKSFLVGTGIFNGSNGTIIPHDFGNTSFSVSVTPTVNPKGSLGEVWVKKTNTMAVVYCADSVSPNTTFDYTLVYYN